MATTKLWYYIRCVRGTLLLTHFCKVSAAGLFDPFPAYLMIGKGEMMRFLIQVVSRSDVQVDGRTVGEIGTGFMVLVGISSEDTQQIADKMIRKLLGLRIFPDENGKTNLSLKDVDGQLLMISQFTLYADCTHGNRPGFTNAAAPDKASALYEYILEKCREQVPVVEKGIFGADMKVTLTNEGPFTILLDSEELFR